METIIRKGWIEVKDFGESDDVLFLKGTDIPLAEDLDSIEEKNVTVRYWISDIEADQESIKEEAIKIIIGSADVSFFARYSEITGYLWTDEFLKIGGHDLLFELKSNEGKYLLLEIDIH